MRTRCSSCETIFRVSPEQLRVRSGMVRCGHCLAVFNAFDHLLEDKPDTALPAVEVVAEMAAPSVLDLPESATPLIDDVEPVLPSEEPEHLPELLVPASPLASEVLDAPLVGDADQSSTNLTQIEVEPAPVAELDHVTALDEAAVGNESAEQSTRAARDAGLVAVRDLSDSPAYNRWAAGTLASGLSGHFEHSASRAPRVFRAVVALLLLVLSAQLVYHFRTALVQRIPDLRQAFAAVNIEVPLAREVDLVSIETSDLQADQARGLLVLQATLKNRASFAQAWPAIELALTDANDVVMVRRVVAAADYLPARTDPSVFPAASEIGIKLWLESPHPAAGYRLYVFYP